MARRSQEHSLHHEEEEKGPGGRPLALPKLAGRGVRGEREKQPSGLSGICGSRRLPSSLMVWQGNGWFQGWKRLEVANEHDLALRLVWEVWP